MIITKDNLKTIMPLATLANISRYCDQLNLMTVQYEINSALRVSMFLANIAEESGCLAYTHELWGPTPIQVEYERDFAHAWPWTKEDRRNERACNLGNSEVGDGVKFKGRGLIQLTGRSNYASASKKFGMDFISHPELLEETGWACKLAGDFWKAHGCNEMADSGDFDGACDLINRGHKTATVGDAIGYKNRLAYFTRAKQVFGA